MISNDKLEEVLAFTENIINQAELLVEVFDSTSSIHSKMEFLMVWMESFRDDLRNHPCLELIAQLKDEI